MAKDFSRSHRVAEQMQRELADLLMFELKDPRVSMVTITGVEVTGDMAHAKIFTAPQKPVIVCSRGWRSRLVFCAPSWQTHVVAHRAATAFCV